jgi:hypothetical protein
VFTASVARRCWRTEGCGRATGDGAGVVKDASAGNDATVSCAAAATVLAAIWSGGDGSGAGGATGAIATISGAIEARGLAMRGSGNRPGAASRATCAAQDATIAPRQTAFARVVCAIGARRAQKVSAGFTTSR